MRDLGKNYVALTHLDKGITATKRIREEAKKTADASLVRNPELKVFDKPEQTEKEDVLETKTKSKKEK